MTKQDAIARSGACGAAGRGDCQGRNMGGGICTLKLQTTERRAVDILIPAAIDRDTAISREIALTSNLQRVRGIGESQHAVSTTRHDRGGGSDSVGPHGHAGYVVDRAKQNGLRLRDPHLDRIGIAIERRTAFRWRRNDLNLDAVRQCLLPAVFGSNRKTVQTRRPGTGRAAVARAGAIQSHGRTDGRGIGRTLH